MTAQQIQWSIILGIIACIIYILSPILGPFIFSAMLAYLGDPFVDKLEKRMSRTKAVLVVYLILIFILTLVILIFIPLISSQIEKLINKIPFLIEFTQSKAIPFINERFGNTETPSSESNNVLVTAIHNQMANLPSLANKLVGWFAGSANWIFTLLANLSLVPVVTFYLLRDWDNLVDKVHSLIPKKYEAKSLTIAKESDAMLAAFLRGQFMVMNILGVIYATGLTIVGLDFGILIGFISGWLSFVPYLGLIIGMSIAVVMAFFQFHDIIHPLGVVIVYVIAQGVEGSILTPKFVGEKISLHPVAVIFAVLAGGQLAGFTGILLALPVTAILNVIISHAHAAYRKSKLYTE